MGRPYVRSNIVTNLTELGDFISFQDDFDSTLFKWTLLGGSIGTIERLATDAYSGLACMRLKQTNTGLVPFATTVAARNIAIPNANGITLELFYRIVNIGLNPSLIIQLNADDGTTQRLITLSNGTFSNNLGQLFVRDDLAVENNLGPAALIINVAAWNYLSLSVNLNTNRYVSVRHNNQTFDASSISFGGNASGLTVGAELQIQLNDTFDTDAELLIDSIRMRAQ